MAHPDARRSFKMPSHVSCDLRVEPGGGLVQQEQLRIVQQGARDATFWRVPFESSTALVSARSERLSDPTDGRLPPRERPPSRGRRRRPDFHGPSAGPRARAPRVEIQSVPQAAPVARVRRTPSTTTDPLVGAISPPSIRRIVVLPAPFGPSNATISDAAHFERDVVDDDPIAETPGQAVGGDHTAMLGQVRQYFAVSRMAARMSADCGRMASSRSGQ